VLQQQTDILEDESRPICTRCQRCGFDCDGPKDMTFIEGTIVKSRRTLPKTPPSTSLRANEFERYVCYSLQYLTRGALIEVSSRDMGSIGVSETEMTVSSGRLSHQAVISFATIFFGTQHKQVSITKRGYTMYGVALNQINQAISDRTYCTLEELLLSVVTLAILEAIVPTGPGNNLKHMRAVEGLLWFQDNNSPTSANLSKLYLAVQHMVIFSALHLREPSILARPDWKRLLRSICPENQLHQQDLFNILADCSVLIAKRDKLLAHWQLHTETPSDQRSALRQEALDLLTQICLWRERWDCDERNSYFETALQTPSRNDSLPFTTVLIFPDESVAIMFMFYNITLIYVIQILQSFDFEDLRHHPNNNVTSQHILQDRLPFDEVCDSTDNQYFSAQVQAILEISRSIPYYLDQVSLAGYESSPIPHWALATVWVKIRGIKSAIGRWLMELLLEKNPVLARIVPALASR
jgi:hypothetical protein